MKNAKCKILTNMDKVEKDLEKIRKWITDFDSSRNYLNNNEFMHECIEITNHLRILAIYAINTMPYDKVRDFSGYSREEATIIGNIVRAYKLYDTLSYHVSKGHAEIVAILARLLLETDGKMVYLINSGDTSRRNYILVSHKANAIHLKDLTSKAKRRNLTPIENRILNNIGRSLKKDGLTREAVLNNKGWKMDGKSEEQLLPRMAYDYIYRTHSASVHGTWQDISIYQLDYSDGKYMPRLEYNSTDPRHINPASIFFIDLLRIFLDWNNGDPHHIIDKILSDLRNITLIIEAKHESYYEKKYQKFLKSRKNK